MPHNSGSEIKMKEFKAKVTRTSGDSTSESKYEKRAKIVTYGPNMVTLI